jgi:hypothetical protein
MRQRRKSEEDPMWFRPIRVARVPAERNGEKRGPQEKPHYAEEEAMSPRSESFPEPLQKYAKNRHCVR